MMRTKSDSTLTMVVGMFVFTFLFSHAHGNGGNDYTGIPKDAKFCAARYTFLQCCDGRQDGDRHDDCSAPLYSTVCYCDDFCNRTVNDDCCPDYWSHCKGMIEIPPQTLLLGCEFKGENYYEGDEVYDNCNKCSCSRLDGKTEMLCERNRCLVENTILQEVNDMSPTLGWQAANYSQFWGKTLEDGIVRKLGTLNPARSMRGMNPLRDPYNINDIPLRFNSQEHWRGLISGIRDQGWCGASWALSTVDVASDRYAIMSMGREAVKLAAQHLLSCNTAGQRGCKGGYLDRAWQFTRKFGLVDDGCYPWVGKVENCRLKNKRKVNLVSAGCRPLPGSRRTTAYKMAPAYRLGNETDIMYEIQKSGPVQATMKVYQDFFVYRGGVYRHSRAAETYPTGYHSVRIVGWGEERSTYGAPVKYWTVANSWGSEWGENGYFRIARGVNECEIETYVLGAWAMPKV